MAKSKALSPEVTAKIREEIRAWVEKDHGGNTSAAARALGLSQPAIRDVLLGNRGAGAKLIDAFATKTGRSIDEILGRPSVTPDDTAPQWGNLQGYRDAERALRGENPHRYPEAVFIKARGLRGVMPLELPVTPAALRRLLNWIEENVAIEELADIESARLDRKLARDIKAAETREKTKAAKAAKTPELPKGKG